MHVCVCVLCMYVHLWCAYMYVCVHVYVLNAFSSILYPSILYPSILYPSILYPCTPLYCTPLYCTPVPLYTVPLHRYYVIFKMPNLAFLDSKPVTSQERKEAKRVGEFMKIVRPSAEVVGIIIGGGLLMESFDTLSVSSCRKEAQI